MWEKDGDTVLRNPNGSALIRASIRTQLSQPEAPGSALRPPQNEFVVFFSPFLILGDLVEMAPAYSHSKPNKTQLSSLDSVHVQPMQRHKNQCALILKLEIHKLL